MVIFTSKFLIDVTEYFIYYDFYFFQNIDYVNYGQVVSYFLEFARLVKRTMVFALGRTQCSFWPFWRDFGLIGKISVLPRRYWQVYSSDSGKIMNHTSMWSFHQIFYEVAYMLCNCLRVRCEVSPMGEQPNPNRHSSTALMWMKSLSPCLH